MKKLIVILLLCCLVGVAAVGFLQSQSRAGLPAQSIENPAPAQTGTAEPAPEAAPAAPAAPAETAPEAVAVQTLDLDRLYAEHEPGEIVMRVGGEEESWSDYFYFLASQVDYVESFFASMASYYGLELHWNDVAEGEDETYADLAAEGAADALRQFAAIEGFARDNGVQLGEENRAAMAEQREQDIVLACGDGASEEDFAAYLESVYMTQDMYRRIGEVNQLYRENFIQVYGENGEKLEEDAALQYLEDNGYLSASHILLMTVDPYTQEALDEAAAAEKRATAGKLAAELQAIEDPAQLLERFAHLKELYCEDSGKRQYPAGYTFTPGTMVPEFEQACTEMEDYQVSDPILTDYGYHIIMKLPYDADALLFSSSGEPLTARATAANLEYGQRLQSILDALEIEYAEGFAVPDLLQYVNK